MGSQNLNVFPDSPSWYSSPILILTPAKGASVASKMRETWSEVGARPDPPSRTGLPSAPDSAYPHMVQYVTPPVPLTSTPQLGHFMD